jgi:thioredoxin 2
MGAKSMSDPQMIRCAECGAMNRVALEKLQAGLDPICGRCKKPLSLTPHPMVVTDATFAELVERSPLPVLIDMWAPWCGPCRMLTPIVEALAGELTGRIRVGKLNVDENPATSQRFRIQNIPALLLFRNGGEVDRIVGAQPKSEILRRLQPFL